MICTLTHIFPEKPRPGYCVPLATIVRRPDGTYSRSDLEPYIYKPEVIQKLEEIGNIIKLEQECEIDTYDVVYLAPNRDLFIFPNDDHTKKIRIGRLGK